MRSSEKPKHFVAEDELGLVGIDVRDGMPRTLVENKPAGDDGVNVRIPIERRSKGLDDSHHAWTSVGLLDDGGHHLADGFVGESCELSQKLSMVEEVRPEHFG